MLAVSGSGRVQASKRGALASLRGTLARAAAPIWRVSALGWMVMATAMTLAAQIGTEPEVEVQASTATPRIGESFELEVAVTWSGTESGGELLPPKIEIPAGVEAGELRATSAAGGRLGVVYGIELVGLEAGRVTLGPIEIRYRRQGSEEVAVLIFPGPDVEVRARSRFWLLAVGVLVAGGLGWLGFMRLRGSGDEDAPVSVSPRQLLEGARRCRLDADVAGCLEALASTAALIDEYAPELSSRIAGLVERARFGGESPSRSELAGLERELELRIGEMESTRGDGDDAGE